MIGAPIEDVHTVVNAIVDGFVEEWFHNNMFVHLYNIK